MKPDDFEQKLSRQPLRKIPGEWRAEILTAARAAQPACRPSPVTRHSWLSTINSQLSTLLWPHPKAWAGLAAAWILIFAVDLSMRDTTPVMAKKSAPSSPETIAELKKQQRMYVELMGMSEPASDTDRRKILSPKPRSERVEILTT